MKRGVRDQYTPKVFDFRSWKDVTPLTEMQEVWEVQGPFWWHRRDHESGFGHIQSDIQVVIANRYSYK